MPIDTRNAKILAAAKARIAAGDLAKAQEYLLMAEGEEAEKLLDRVNKAIAARGVAPKGETVAPITSKAVAEGIKQAEKEKAQLALKNGCIFTLALFACLFSCVMFGAYMGAPRTEENLAKMCQQIEDVGFRCNPQDVMRDYPVDVNFCQASVGNWDTDRPYRWESCMYDRGVEFPLKQ